MTGAPTERTRVRRHPERADYDRDMVERIVDEALICHVAWIDDEGRPRVLPTIQARVGDTLYLHGSRAARAWKAVAGGRRGLRRGDDRGRSRAGAERVQPLDELPQRRAVRAGARGHRSRRAPRRGAGDHAPRPARPRGRGADADGRRVPPDDPVRDPDRRGVREGPDRAADRRRGRPRGADLGGGPAARHGRRGARGRTRSHGRDRRSRPTCAAPNAPSHGSTHPADPWYPYVGSLYRPDISKREAGRFGSNGARTRRSWAC